MKAIRKNILTRLLACALMILVVGSCIASPAHAETTTETTGAQRIVLTIGEGNMEVDRTQVQIDGAVPLINNGRTYIPLRAVAEAFGAEVDYQGASGDITIENDGSKVVMNTLASVYSVNGVLKWMDMAPYVNSDDRTMVPVRFVSEGLGYNVETEKNDAGKIQFIIITRTAGDQ